MALIFVVCFAAWPRVKVLSKLPCTCWIAHCQGLAHSDFGPPWEALVWQGIAIITLQSITFRCVPEERAFLWPWKGLPMKEIIWYNLWRAFKMTLGETKDYELLRRLDDVVPNRNTCLARDRRDENRTVQAFAILLRRLGSEVVIHKVKPHIVRLVVGQLMGWQRR